MYTCISARTLLLQSSSTNNLNSRCGVLRLYTYTCSHLHIRQIGSSPPPAPRSYRSTTPPGVLVDCHIYGEGGGEGLLVGEVRGWLVREGQTLSGDSCKLPQGPRPPSLSSVILYSPLEFSICPLPGRCAGHVSRIF
jgi:hypothetical protein